MKTVEAHLRERRYNTSLHKAFVDEKEKVATFPLWNLSGQFVGYQQYRPDASKEVNNNPRDSRYYTYLPKGVMNGKGKSGVGVWGLESWHHTNTLFLTEGIFDAAALTQFGASAVAVLGYSMSSTTLNWLHTVRQSRPVVAVCDPDASGVKLGKYGHESHFMEEFDLGDVPDDYVERLVEKYR